MPPAPAGFDNRASSIYPPTISPPDSPRTNDADDSSQPNVSPISTAAPSQPWLRPSAIPIPRKAPASATASPPVSQDTRAGWRDVVKTIGRSSSPGQQHHPREQSPAAASAGDEPTRWDGYSGEKAANGQGKPGAVSPTQHPYTGTGEGFGYSAQITGGTGKPSHFLGVKLKRAGDRPAVPPKNQEPWKSASGARGPSGRTATIDPIEAGSSDKKHFPTPSERRARGLFQKQGNNGRTSPGPSVGLGIRSETPTGRQTPQQDERERPSGGLRVITGAILGAANNMMQYRDKSPDPPRPTTSVPEGPNGEVVVNQTMRYKYKLGDSSSREQSPMTPTYERGLHQQASETLLRGAYLQQGRSFTAPVVTDSPATYGSVPNMFHVPPRKDSKPMIGTSSSDDFDALQITSAFHSMGFDNQPKSHFSATTYNTSVADSSPPQTPAIPGHDDVPPLPTAPAAISILNRKRPVPSTSNQFRAKPARKPTPGAGGLPGDASDLPDSTATAPASTEATEPPKPVDRIKELEERLKMLNKRKISLAQMIHELTNVVHPSSVHYDIASREEIKKSVARMRTEQDVVLAEIQECGIKLHRAVRKRDELDGCGGGAGLWVRRVTE